MKFSIIRAFAVLSLFAVCLSPFSAALGQENPDLAKIKQALKISPKQRGVDVDVPDEADLNSCRIERAVDTYKVPGWLVYDNTCLLYTSPSPRDQRGSRMPSSA